MSPPADRGSDVDAPNSDSGPKDGTEDRLFKRSDLIIGVILAGIAWSFLSYMAAVAFMLGDAVDPGAPEWALIAMMIVAPITTVVALVGVLFRRWWVRWPAVVLVVALVGLWIVARIELAPYWSDPLFGLLSFPWVPSSG